MDIESIDTSLLTRRPLAVKVIKVESPTLIWVHILNGDEQFRYMLDDLQRRMTQRARYVLYQPDDVNVDDIVAVKEDNKWQRGYVLETRGQQAHVALKDWGRDMWVPFHECHELQAQFREVEWRAVPCGLAYVGPVRPTDTWPSKTKAITRTLASGRRGWITIRLPMDYNTAALVDLSMENSAGNGEFDLAEILHKLGYVERIEQMVVDIFPAV